VARVAAGALSLAGGGCGDRGVESAPGEAWHFGASSRRLALVLLLACAAIPLAGALAIAFRQPDFHERYAIMLSAPLILLSAIGLVEAGRRAI